MVKLVVMIRRKNNMTVDEFSRHWREVHAPLVVRHVPGLRKYVQNHPIRVAGFESNVDGVTEEWFDDLDALQNYRNLRQTNDVRLKPLLDDEPKFVDFSSRIYFIAEEHIIK